MTQRSAHLSRLKQFERGTETLLARIDDLSHPEKCGLLDAAFQHWSQACWEKWNIDLLQVVQLWSNSNKNATENPIDEDANLSSTFNEQLNARAMRASRRRRNLATSPLCEELCQDDEAEAESVKPPSTTPPGEPSSLDLSVDEHALVPTLPAVLPASELPALAAPTALMTLPPALPTAPPQPLPTAPPPTPLPTQIPDSDAEASTSDDEPLSAMAKRVRRVKTRSSIASTDAVIDPPVLPKSGDDQVTRAPQSVPSTTQLESGEFLFMPVRGCFATATRNPAKLLTPNTVVLGSVTDSTTDDSQDTLAPTIALLKRGTKSTATQTPHHGPLLEDERATKRLKVSKVASTQPAARSKISTTSNLKSDLSDVIDDEEIGVIVEEALAELREAGIYGKVGLEEKILKLVQVVIRALSRDGTRALHRLLPLEDDWANTEARKFQQDHRNASTRLDKLIVAYYTFRNADESRPFGSCLRNIGLVTLFREHTQLVAEIRNTNSATRRELDAAIPRTGPSAPVSLLNTYVAQKVNVLEAESSSTRPVLAIADMGPDVLAGRLLDKYSSSLGRGALYLLRFSRSHLTKYTLDEHQAVVNALARRNDLVKMFGIVKDYIMKPMLDEKVNGLAPVKTFLARWDRHMKSLEHLAKWPKAATKIDLTRSENVDDAEHSKHASAVRQDSAVHIQAE